MKLIAYASLKTLPHMYEGDIRILDAVNLFSIQVLPDGTAALMDDNLDFSCVARYRAINPNIKFLLMLGGCNHCSDAFLRKSGRERFAETLMELLKAYDLDGLDNDWEVPTMTLGSVRGRPVDKYTYTMMMQEIRRRMDEEEARIGRHYLLTCAQSAQRFIIDTVEVEKLVPLVDYINVMTYDLRGTYAAFELHDDLALPSGHHTCTYPTAGDTEALCAQYAVELFRAWGVPDEKIVIGSGIYTKHYDNCGPENNGLLNRTNTREFYLQLPGGDGISQLTTSNQSRLLPYLKENGYVRYWDDDAKASWWYSESKRDFVSLDDEESLWHKVQYIKKEGLLGLMFWRYEMDDLHTLIAAAGKAAHEN